MCGHRKGKVLLTALPTLILIGFFLEVLLLHDVIYMHGHLVEMKYFLGLGYIGHQIRCETGARNIKSKS